MSGVRRARCSVCGAPYAVRRDGMIRHHDDGRIMQGYRVCAGSGKPPRVPSTSEGEGA